MSKNFFNPVTWWKRFGYALQGLRSFFVTEHTAWIHLLATIIVIIVARIVRVSAMEALILVLVIGVVWVAEIFNTAIEKLSDLVSEKWNVSIKLVKDLAAAAVLMASITALITGLIIFIPKLVHQ